MGSARGLQAEERMILKKGKTRKTVLYVNVDVYIPVFCMHCSGSIGLYASPPSPPCDTSGGFFFSFFLISPSTMAGRDCGVALRHSSQTSAILKKEIAVKTMVCTLYPVQEKS